MKVYKKITLEISSMRTWDIVFINNNNNNVTTIIKWKTVGKSIVLVNFMKREENCSKLKENVKQCNKFEKTSPSVGV